MPEAAGVGLPQLSNPPQRLWRLPLPRGDYLDRFHALWCSLRTLDGSSEFISLGDKIQSPLEPCYVLARDLSIR
jgi:hypothetical protein